MACCSSTIATCPAPASAAQSPSLHVNFTKGMVLGVDDFTQEFAYLAGRDEWMVRELGGNGVLRGLAVTAEDDGTNGPRIRVARGSAATASGKLVCVAADQCGSLNAWLAVKDNADAVTRLLGTGTPPVPPPPASPPAVLPLYVTLCYATSLVAPVPIPGDPCRSDDMLMAPSRVADDFRIELRLTPPGDAAADGMAAFIRWLRAVPIDDASPPAPDELAEWLASLRAAAPSWYPSLPPPPAPVPRPLVAAVDWPDFIRFAVRFWAREVAPLVAPTCGDPPGSDSDCLSLARLEVPVLFAGGTPSGAWQVAGAASTIKVGDTERALLLPGRLLQEWVLSDPARVGLTKTGATQVAFTSTNAALTLDGTHGCVVCTAAVTVTLPKAGPALQGRVYTLKAAGGQCTVAPAASDTVETARSLAIPATQARILVCDGVSAWFVIGATT